MELLLNTGSYYKPVNFQEDKDNKFSVRFNYDAKLVEHIKSMAGARWNPENPQDKHWIIDNSKRNLFRLNYLAKGFKNPYEKYRIDLPKIDHFSRPLYDHQKEMVSHILGRRQCILAAEMGTGKTLTVIEALERGDIQAPFYIAPKSALAAVKLEFRKWDAQIRPEFMTYESLKRTIKDWHEGHKAPDAVIFDECSKIKNWGSQRTQAAWRLVLGMWEDWDNPMIVGMSGTPAPKNPADWWSQCEIVCPGYLKEGNVHKFTQSLALVRKENSIAGGSYPKIVTWWDDENKCLNCGKFKNHLNHSMGECKYESSTNEVSRFYYRVRGFVYVCFKKDCLDLPDKIYREIDITPTAQILRLEETILKASSTTIEALTLTRELSDGFQYVNVEVGETECPKCGGSCETQIYYHKVTGEPLHLSGIADTEVNYDDYEIRNGPCYKCDATGEIAIMERQAKYIDCPKDDALRDILDQHDDIGRLIIYAGFLGSVDRIVKLCIEMSWDVIRLDSRDFKFFARF